MSGEHVPVMLEEVLEVMAPRDGALYVDGTFGGGGYTRGLLESASCRVVGIDRDPEAISRGEAFITRYEGRLSLVCGRYSEMAELLASQGESGTDGVVLDIGVSSFQLDEPGRGFSFRADGPLDMRMSNEGRSAADIVNHAEERELAELISKLGEEREARRVARAIVAARPIARTAELAEVVATALGPRALRQPIHPATRTFQALRIAVNDELAELDSGLRAAERVLRPEGRLAVVAFHSLEDRIVKQFLAQRSGAAASGSRHAPERAHRSPATFRILSARPRMPSPGEVSRNPRARSARLRAAERTSVPVATQE